MTGCFSLFIYFASACAGTVLATQLVTGLLLTLQQQEGNTALAYGVADTASLTTFKLPNIEENTIHVQSMCAASATEALTVVNVSFTASGLQHNCLLCLLAVLLCTRHCHRFKVLPFIQSTLHATIAYTARPLIETVSLLPLTHVIALFLQFTAIQTVFMAPALDHVSAHVNQDGQEMPVTLVSAWSMADMAWSMADMAWSYLSVLCTECAKGPE